jgi:Polyketide cyclase / dehydrase and lipid transport
MPDSDDWARWQPDIARAKLAGSLAAGSTFSWETAGLAIVSVLADVQAPERLAWHGEANGIVGIHVWAFSPHEKGTIVATEESWEGELPASNVPELRRALDASLVRWLSFLKAHVEA